MKKKILIFLAILIVISGVIAYLFFFHFAKNDIKVLLFSKTEAFRHESIEAGVQAIRKLGSQNDFIVEATEDAANFNEDYLQDFQVIVFLNTTSDVLDPVQQSEMERFIQAGGGFVGIHAATDTEYGWPWYGELVGAYFESHPTNPNIQEAELTIVNPNHPATDFLPSLWKTEDEWYNFKSIYPENRVLIMLDESTYTGGTNGENHPISWYKEFDGGRSFYTGLGHTEEQYEDSLFMKHLLGGIKYAIGPGTLIDYSRAYSEVIPEENRFTKVVFKHNLNEPMELDFISDDKIIYIERKGALHIYDLEKGVEQIAGQLDVFHGLEDGLLGVAVDPNYQQNHWVYLYYSENSADSVQNLSRFVLQNDSLLLDTEKILLQIPTQREECCHSGGSIEFGPDGNLYLSVGDNTNPHESNGFAPIDERKGRSAWDAQKSSANSKDLRGKILRITPQDDGTYSIPAGNLFAKDDPKARPEVYIMGNRNPFRISIDSRTGYLYWGEVGPDASADSSDMGVRGYDEINQAKKAGNFGWPYFIADNQAYHDYDFVTKRSGAAFDTLKPMNNSPNNTGLTQLPPANPAMVYYPYGASEVFPALGSGARNAMAGPVYYGETYGESGRNWPEYFDGKLLIYDWMRGWIFALAMQQDGSLDKLTQIVPNMDFHNIIDMTFGPDGALYILEYGSGWFSQNADATLSRIEFARGNRVPQAKIVADKTIGATPLTVNFDGRNSIDYDGDSLTYSWVFGNGQGKSSEAAPTITFEESGKYRVSLEVEDSQGKISTTETEVLVGNELPELSWEILEGNSQFYWPGEEVNIEYNIQVSDAEDGSLADGSLDASRVLVSFDYLPQGSDMVIAAKDHAQIVDEAYASIGKGLIDASDCMACHKEKEVSIGPSYQAIAERYAGDKEAVIKLADKILNGGGGNWGEVPMAAHPGISDTEAKQIAEYILALGESQQQISKYPVKGTFNSKEHIPSDTRGSYILTASYADLGGGKIESMTAKEVLQLKYPRIEAEEYDEGQAMKFNVKADETPGVDEDMNIVIGRKNDYLMFEDIDLTGVSRCNGRYVLVGGITKGGTIEFRLGGRQGDIIGVLDIKVNITDFIGMEQLVVDFGEPLKGTHDLFVIFKSREAAADDIVTVVDWWELLRESSSSSSDSPSVF